MAVWSLFTCLYGFRGVVSVEEVNDKARDGNEASQLRPSRVERPAVSAWLRREVQVGCCPCLAKETRILASHS